MHDLGLARGEVGHVTARVVEEDRQVFEADVVQAADLGDECRARWVATAGNTTYSSYLLNLPLQMALVLWVAHAGWQIPREGPAFFLACLGLSPTLGVLAFRAFEMPMQNRLRRMARIRAPAQQAANPAP